MARESEVAIAIAIAADHHMEDYDKGGEPYILHCLRVMQDMDSDLGKVVAVLHDSIEDAPSERARDIRKDQISTTFGNEVMIHLHHLTRKFGDEDYLVDYIGRVRLCRLCTQIKLADLKDNLNVLRQPTMTDKDLGRLQKYHMAYRALRGAT